jgi:L-ascorbate metabolism protein UlaG (beta-lactamase superfamily)
MNIGGARSFPFGRLKFTIAHHSSAGPNGESLGNPMGVLLTLGGRTIYHAGDTGLFLDMKLIGERHPIDVAIVPIGDNFTMGPEDAVAAIEFLNPKVAIPMHYNTFPPIEVDPAIFIDGVRALGIDATIVEPGETYTLRTEAA